MGLEAFDRRAGNRVPRNGARRPHESSFSGIGQIVELDAIAGVQT